MRSNAARNTTELAAFLLFSPNTFYRLPRESRTNKKLNEQKNHDEHKTKELDHKVIAQMDAVERTANDVGR